MVTFCTILNSELTYIFPKLPSNGETDNVPSDSLPPIIFSDASPSNPPFNNHFTMSNSTFDAVVLPSRLRWPPSSTAVPVRGVARSAALGADRYLSSLTTISDVEVSADLQVVKVYVSVFGDERGKEVALAGLKSKAKYVRGELGKRMKLRLTPEVRFLEDESLERGSRVIAILDKIKDENKKKPLTMDPESLLTEAMMIWNGRVMTLMMRASFMSSSLV
ncbi:hypothetical protein DH2020_029576 [Rehmannia glutinosa]|uniref:Ribosome-binding factor A, chloroplastic n=1 Tax=Rehmannia glutinosa TaxID=99300 RepID=A0ABR0VRS2_REHGL